MALKQCSLCDRKFTKLEHVKRHERSHTRERPYECPTCKKHFSRSDVLFRHCKGHTQTSLNRLNIHQAQGSRRTPQSSQNPTTDKSAQGSISQIDRGTDSVRSPSMQQDPNLSPLGARRDSQQPSQTNGGRDSFSSPSGELRHPGFPHNTSSPGDSRMEALINAAQHLEPAVHETWRTPSPVVLASEHRAMSRHHDSMPPHIDPAIEMLSFSPAGHVSSLDQWAFELVQSNHPIPNRTHADALQTWLFPLESDILNHGPHHLIEDHFQHDAFRYRRDNQTSPSGSTASIASRIPRERFSRVESCWPAKNRKSTRLMPILWESLIACDCDNFLAEMPPGAVQTPMTERERRSSRWGLDDACREILQNAINNAPSPMTGVRSESLGDTASSTGGETAGSPGVEGFQFPPAEILDIALEMYLYHFHPTLPILHIPSFSAKTSPRPLLLTMCLIGLSILGTAGASKFVAKTYPAVLQMVSSELESLSTTEHAPEKQLCIIATSLLALNLASITGRKGRISQSQKLYRDLISLAQSNDLFCAGEGPQPEVLLEEVMDLEAKWKAWTRIECAKRIILGLIEIDCWYAAYLSTAPMIRPESVQIIPPAEYNLYHSNSATKWLQSVQRGARVYPGRIAPSFLPTPGIKIDNTSLRSLLTLFILRIYESTDRLANTKGSQKILEPWRRYSDDPRSRELIPLLVNLSSSSIDALRTADLNSVVLWHASCMLLGANIRYFELAAGRSGPGPAVGALEDISAWTQTASARRSVLHAAHIFKILYDRKVSDIVNPHSVVALFQAALVLGLYIFTLPPNTPSLSHDGNCLELLELVDWTCIGHLGFVDTPNSPSTPIGYSDGTALNFIRNGGPFSITGIPLEGGYLAARRTLLHCADLMDGMGRWKSRTFSQILHIMSDDLTDVDVGDSDDS